MKTQNVNRRFATVWIIVTTMMLMACASADSAFPPAFQNRMSGTSASLNDLVIGDDPVDETLIITSTFAHTGNILIINQGHLIVRGSSGHMVLTGNLHVSGDGHFTVEDGTFELAQRYQYEFTYAADDNARIQFERAKIICNLWPCDAGFFGNSHIRFDQTEADTHATAVATDDAVVEVIDSSHSLELLMFERAQADFQNADNFIMWLDFAEGCQIDTVLPESGDIPLWTFDDQQPGISGIDYQVSVTDGTDVIIGFISWPGSQVLIRDSNIRVAGVVLQEMAPQSLTGIVNGASYDSLSFPLADRQLQIVNTTVSTWNLYTFNDQQLQLTNCILGEVISYGSSGITLQETIVDGTGGYLGSYDSSRMVFSASTAMCPVIARGQSIFLFAQSAQLYFDFIATDNAITIMFNPFRDRPPVVNDIALLVDAAIRDPFNMTPADSMVPIRGTADVIPGPEQPLRFKSYTMAFGAGDAPLEWTPIGAAHVTPVHDGWLETWDTHGLGAGDYTLQLSIFTDMPDPVTLTHTVQVGPYPTFTPEPPTPTPPPPTPTPHPEGVNLDLLLNAATYRSGDSFELRMAAFSHDFDRYGDVYIALEAGGSFWFWDAWTAEPSGQRRFLPSGETFAELIVRFDWPDIYDSGQARFWGAILQSGSTNLISGLALAEFGWE